DHPEGVDHALCARVTDLLREYLREYTVDVSSPGTARPLRKPQHFAGVVGRTVSLRTAEPLAGRSRFKGEVTEARARVERQRRRLPRGHSVRVDRAGQPDRREGVR